jgi:hypothetical protein
MNYCKVYGCRFSDTHLTRAHKCGACGKYGHGQIECGNSAKIEQLKIISQGTRFPTHMYCQAPGCRASYSHTSDSHTCHMCSGRHFESGCPQNHNAEIDPTSESYAISEGQKILKNTIGSVFADVYAGMGCQWFVKRDSPHSPIKAFFMHSDSWGQYGPQSNDQPKLVEFLNGYRHFETGKFFDPIPV